MKSALAILLGLALWQPAASQDDTPRGCEQHAERVYTTKEVDEKAKLTYRSYPPFPTKLRGSRRKGETKLRMVLRPDGRVTDIEVLESSHEEFSKASVEAAKKFRFEPARKGGCPVAQSTLLVNQYRTF